MTDRETIADLRRALEKLALEHARLHVEMDKVRNGDISIENIPTTGTIYDLRRKLALQYAAAGGFTARLAEATDKLRTWGYAENPQRELQIAREQRAELEKQLNALRETALIFRDFAQQMGCYLPDLTKAMLSKEAAAPLVVCKKHLGCAHSRPHKKMPVWCTDIHDCVPVGGGE